MSRGHIVLWKAKPLHQRKSRMIQQMACKKEEGVDLERLASLLLDTPHDEVMEKMSPEDIALCVLNIGPLRAMIKAQIASDKRRNGLWILVGMRRGRYSPPQLHLVEDEK